MHGWLLLQNILKHFNLVLWYWILGTSCFVVRMKNVWIAQCPMSIHEIHYLITFLQYFVSWYVPWKLVLLNLVLLTFLVLGTSCFGAIVWNKDEECVHRLMSILETHSIIPYFDTWCSETWYFWNLVLGTSYQGLGWGMCAPPGNVRL